MSRRLSGRVYLAGFVLMLIAFAMFFISSVTNGRFPVDVALALAGAGVILGIVGWIGALIRLAQLRRWGWFAAVLLTNLGMFVYILSGPDDPPK